MRTIRLAWPPETPADPAGEVFLDQAQARHGALVLRLKSGAPVEMVSPFGLAPAVVNTISFASPFSRENPGLAVELSGPWEKGLPGGPRLALALIQGQRFDWAVEKSVELGAAQLIPLICARCKSADAHPGSARQERWQRLALSAHKQCGRFGSLKILAPQSVPELLKQPGPGFFLSPSDQSLSVKSDLFASPSPLLAIGPEGGFSKAEEQSFVQGGFRPLNLGPVVLRAETAALAVLSIFLGQVE